MESQSGPLLLSNELSTPTKADSPALDIQASLFASNASSIKRPFSEISPTRMNRNNLEQPTIDGGAGKSFQYLSQWNPQYSHNELYSEQNTEQLFSVKRQEQSSDGTPYLVKSGRLPSSSGPRSFSNPTSLEESPHRHRKPLTKLSVAETIRQAQAGTARALQVRCGKQNDEIWNLKAKLLQAQAELAKAPQQYSDHEYDNLRSQFSELETQHNDALSRCKTAAEEIEQLSLHVERLTTEREKLEEELQRNGEEMEAASKGIDELDNALTQTHQELCEARQQHLADSSALDQLRDENQQLSDRIETLLIEFDSLKTEKNELCSNVNSLQQEKETLENSIANLNSELRAATASFQDTKVEIGELENAISDAEIAIHDLRSENSALNSLLENERIQNDRKLSSMEQKCHEELSKVKQANDMLNNEVNCEIKQEKLSHAETVGKLNDAKQALANLDMQTLKLQQDFDMCKAMLDGKEEEYTQRVHELEALQVGLQNKNTQLEQTLFTAREKLADVQRSADIQLQHHKDQFESVKLEYTKFAESQNAEIIYARSQTFELAEALDREKRWRDDRDAKIVELEELLNIRKVGFEQDIAELVGETCQLKQQLSELKRTNEQLDCEVEQARNLRKVLKDRQDSSEQVALLNQNLAEKISLLAQEREITRRLQNQIQELKGNIRIVARVRPGIASKNAMNSSSALINMKLSSSEIVLQATCSKAMGGERQTESKFQYDRVFGPNVTNLTVCEETEYLIQSALDGKQASILAYGQTGSGKTYTMGGRDGISSYAITKIMEVVNHKKDQYSVSVEAIEIYNNQMRDLLDSSVRTMSMNTACFTSVNTHKLSLKQNLQTGIPELIGANRVEVSSTADALNVMNRAVANRSVAATACNERSSRSHFIFTVHVTSARVNSRSSDLHGCLHLVDLAGSERTNTAKTNGARFTESTAINQSLSSLGNVVHALINQTSNTHISYRDNPLTHLLQGALSKNAKTMLLITLAPELASAEETRSTLRFADMASRAILK